MNPLPLLKKIPSSWGPQLVLLIIIAADLTIRRASILSSRPGEFLLWPGSYLGFYALSALLSLCLLIILRSALQPLWRRTPGLARAALGLALLFMAALCVFSWEYYRYFAMIPTIYTFQLIGLEPAEAKVSILAALGPGVIAGLVLLAVLFFVVLRRHLEDYRPLGLPFVLPLILSVAAGAGAWAVLNNNIRFVDQCLTPETNAMVTFVKFKFDPKASDYFNRAGLHAGSRPALKPAASPVPFHTLLIINESLRRNNLPCYGSLRETTPNLLRRMREAPGEYFVFRKAYANATTTMVAYPALLAGATAAAAGLTLHSQPLLWDYGKAAGCFTALVSSHLYHWRNLLTFIRGPGLDRLWYQEVSGHAPLDSRYFGIDDKFTVEEFISCIEEARTAGAPFFGVLHTFDTHFPYYSPDSLKKFDPPPGEYDNSILYLDRNLERLFSFLEERGIWDSTVVLFTSDHGEAFNEHGVNGHITNLFIETMAVPMWIRFPARLQPSFPMAALIANLGRPVTNADLSPTVAEMLGLAADSAARRATEQGGGASLFSPLPEKRALVMTNNTEYSVNRDNYFTSVVTGDTLFQCWIENGRPALRAYDLAIDFLCTRDLWPAMSPEYRAAVRNALAGHPNTLYILEKTKVGAAFKP